MERRMGKWGRSPYRLFWYFVLLCIAAVFLLVFGIFYRDGREMGVVIGGDSCSEGQELEAELVRIWPFEVKSCVWYVGEEAASRADRLHSYTPGSEDVEQLIRLEVTLKDGSVFEDFRYCSVLPVLYLESSVPYEDVEKDSESLVYARLEGNGYMPDSLYEGEAYVRVRGNSTSVLEKRPFKLRLKEKAELLGMREGRHWALLANAVDSTLLRNQTASLISQYLGAEYVMDSRQVTLLYNGAYCGVYQLYEQIRVEDSRVDVYDWERAPQAAAERIVEQLEIEKENRTLAKQERKELLEMLEYELTADLSWLDTGIFESGGMEEWNAREGTCYPTVFTVSSFLELEALPEATGGVLLEMDFWEEERALETNYLQPFYFASPEAGETFRELYDYVSAELQALEYAFHDTDFTYHSDSVYYETAEEGWCDYGNGFVRRDVTYRESDFSDTRFDGQHYSELADMDSLVNNFLLCEFSMNWDAMKNSVFLCKDLEGPYHIDLAWDYDCAWGNSMFGLNTWYPEEWQTTSDYFANETYYQTVQWNRFLIRDPYFLALAQEKYWQIREPFLEELVRDGGLIDRYAEALAPAAEANDKRWGGSMGTYEGETFREGVERMKEFMRLRLAWLDEQFASVETLRTSLGGYLVSDMVWVERVDTGAQEGKTRIVVCAGAPGSRAASLQVNGVWFYEEELEGGEAEFWLDDSVLRLNGGVNTVQVRLLDEEGEYLVNSRGTVEGEYTNAVSAYACFTKPVFE